MIRFVAALGLLCFVETAIPADSPRPNVLLVLADDQRFDTIRSQGNAEIHTPTLDGLIDRGFAFNNAYCQGSLVPAVCTPSRTMLLSGRSLFRIPSPQAKTFDGPSLGKVFRSAGYDTLCVSKPGNSFRAAHDHFETVIHIPHVGTATNQRCADAVLKYLDERRSDRPFFVYLAPSMPHDPRTAEPEFHKLYDPARLTLSRSFLPRHPFDNGELAVRDEKLAAIPRDPVEMKKHLADYYACITSLDHHLGRILTVLQKRGQLENTLVVFTSDQGLAVGGRHGLMGKQNLYEHFKSPLVVAGPGVPKGQSDALVYLFDLFPTLCAAAGVEPPKECEGTSLVPVWKGEKKNVRSELFAAYRDVQRMVRDNRWKLLDYPKAGRVQLFDLKTDPDEVTDLSGKPELADRLKTMKQLLTRQQVLWDDPLRPSPVPSSAPCTSSGASRSGPGSSPRPPGPARSAS
jgi:arylsulfatase A-like enzyme